MKNVSKKSIDNVANAANILSSEEQVLLKGGRKRYFIGDDEVSKETYKAFVECATGSPSEH
jgi:hypothetical protein